MSGSSGASTMKSIPILLVRLGRASDFLVAVLILAAVLGIAMVIAYVSYG